jgi:hypothetical protein
VTAYASRILSAFAVLGATAALASGCYSVDPTAQTFSVTFHNDTARNVHLKLCRDDGCHHFYYSDGWKAGQSAEENISDRDVMTRWIVEDDVTGETLGCLPLRFKQKYASVDVRISQAVECPGDRPLHADTGKPLGLGSDSFP